MLFYQIFRKQLKNIKKNYEIHNNFSFSGVYIINVFLQLIPGCVPTQIVDDAKTFRGTRE
jgi:hypothetical protein